MMISEITKPKRGRPPKNHSPNTDVKNIVIQSGIETVSYTHLTLPTNI